FPTSAPPTTTTRRMTVWDPTNDGACARAPFPPRRDRRLCASDRVSVAAVPFTTYRAALDRSVTMSRNVVFYGAFDLPGRYGRHAMSRFSTQRATISPPLPVFFHGRPSAR